MNAMSWEQRSTVLLRCAGRCERCGISIANVPADVHHRRPRGMGGTRDPEIHSPSNLVVICRGCHGWVESHRSEAMHDGWLVPRRDPRTPGDVPIWLYHQDRAYLTTDGSYEWVS